MLSQCNNFANLFGYFKILIDTYFIEDKAEIWNSPFIEKFEGIIWNLN